MVCVKLVIKAWFHTSFAFIFTFLKFFFMNIKVHLNIVMSSIIVALTMKFVLQVDYKLISDHLMRICTVYLSILVPTSDTWYSHWSVYEKQLPCIVFFSSY